MEFSPKSVFACAVLAFAFTAQSQTNNNATDYISPPWQRPCSTVGIMAGHNSLCRLQRNYHDTYAVSKTPYDLTNAFTAKI